MTIAQFAMVHEPQSQLNFVTTGQNVSAALAAVLTRVVTTGDINWSTVLAPTAFNQYRGFEIYALNDSLQTTHPVFMKIEYGASSQSTSSYGLRVTLSKAVDAAGVQSNIFFGPTEILQSGNNVTPVTCYATNGANSGLGIMIAPNTSTNVGMLLIERSRDELGAITGDALYVAYKPSQTASWTNRFYDYAMGTYNQVAGGVGCIPLALAADVSLANATITPYFPVACISPGGTYWIARIALAGSRADCATASVITSLFDSANYIGAGLGGHGFDQRNSQYGSFMMRWD